MAIETRTMVVDKAKSTGTYQYYFIAGPTFYSSTGEVSGVEVIAELIPDNYEGQKVPSIKVQYPSYKPVGEAEQSLRDELALFGYFKNSISYPKTGTSIPPEDNPYPPTESPTETPSETSTPDTSPNTSDTPRYNYSDGTTITFGKFGPEKFAIIKYGSSFGEGDFEIIKGNTSEGQGSFSVGFDILASESIISYNNAREGSGLTPVTLVRVDPPTPPPPPVPFEYSITGKVIDSIINEPLTSTKIKTSGKEGQDVPNSTGDFTLTGETTNEKRITLTFNTSNYTTKTVTPYTGNGNIKSDIGIIGLEPNVKSIEGDKITTSQLSTEEVNKLNIDSGKIGGIVQKRLNDTVTNLKSKVLPTVLLLLAKFGITGVPELIKQAKSGANGASGIIEQIPTDQISCPAPEELKKLIKSKNTLVKTLNNSYKTVDSTTKSIGLSEDTVNTLLGVFNGLDAAMIALPTATGAPGVPGLTVGAVDKLVKEKDNTKDKIDDLKSKITSITPVLALIVSTLLQAISYLDVLDNVVQTCTSEKDDSDSDSDSNNALQDEILDELRQLSTEQSNQQSPIVTDVNGFTMGIETEKTTNPLKRRRAIARNGAGVVMLVGKYSFSSIDQILIDQLVFYIQQNNLKAD